jgi:hypothetical protein
MKILLTSSFYSEFELYEGITDIKAFIEAVKNQDTSKYNIIGCQDDILTADAIQQADKVIYIDDILD